MKRKHKVLASLISVAMILNLGLADILAIAVGDAESASSSGAIQMEESGRAYDPIAALEEERGYREAVRYAEHHLILSMIDERAEGKRLSIGAAPLRFAVRQS